MEAEERVIRLAHWDSSVVHDILVFMYAGRVSLQSLEGALRLLQAAVHFAIESLEVVLLDTLEESVNFQTCVPILQVAAVEDNIPDVCFSPFIFAWSLFLFPRALSSTLFMLSLSAAGALDARFAQNGVLGQCPPALRGR